jgi:beta-glucosidase
MLSGGWTLSWQGEGVSKADFPNSETILDGVRRVVSEAGGETEYSAEGKWNEKPDVAIVVFGEAPYAEFRGDIATLDYKPGDDRDLAMLQDLQKENIPTIAVFLSGRPLWVNPELNASDAFVAAFLPGAQAGALADTLFTDEAGTVIHDFSGKLSFSWPEDADQYRLNPDDPDYDPLFPFGYGLTYADREDIGPLHENAVATDVDYSILFDRGAPLGDWKAFLADGEGVSEWRSGRTSSPTGALAAQSADLGQQENAVRLAWNGNGAARYVMQREPVDLTREVNAHFELIIDYLVETPAEGPVSLTFTCGDECASAFDVSDSFQLSPYGGVSSLAIPLKCLAQNGVDLSRVDTFSLSTSARLTAVISRIGIAPSAQLSECPELAQ